MTLHQEIIEPDDIQVISVPHPFSTDRKFGVVKQGATIDEIFRGIQPDPWLRSYAKIFLNDHSIDRKYWSTLKPKAGTRVTIRVLPHGGGSGGSKNPLRTILTLVILVVAIVVAPYLAPLFVGLGASAGVATGLAVAAITFAGNLILSALIPPPKPKLPSLSSVGGGGADSPTLFITGSRNSILPFGIVPRPLGKHRMVPPMGALPFTETVGEDQYLRLLFVWGHGPIQITDIKIGETLLSNFDDVEIETVNGFPGDPALTLYSDDVFELSLNVLLVQASSWVIRTSQLDAEELSVDIAFLGGLVTIGAQGGKLDTTINVDVEYRTTNPQGSWVSAGSINVTAHTTSVVRRGLRWTVAKDQYDIRLRRTTADTSSSQIVDLVTWTTLRSITIQDPINLAGLAKTAIRIKATDQLNGIVDQLNGIVESQHKSWDGVSTWVNDQFTSNPADLFRAVLQDTANSAAIPDSKLDLPALQDWHDANVTAGNEFNMIIDFQSSVWDTLSDIASAGRAFPSIKDGKWSIIRDIPQTVPIQHFTPRNSWGFSAEKIFPNTPHALRIRFVNRDLQWQQDEQLVFKDGFDLGSATLFEGLDLPGITDAEQVWRDGRYHLAVSQLRSQIYHLSTDMEYIVCTRGDLVKVAHDVPLFGSGFGRIKVVDDDGTNATGIDLDTDIVMEAGKDYVVRVRRAEAVVADESILLNVDTVPGTINQLVFTTPPLIADGPNIGDLFMFGELGLETVDMIVKAIEKGPELTARLTLLDAAPAVHDADTGPIPPFTSNLTIPPGINIPAIENARSDGSVLLRDPDGSFQSRILVTLIRPSSMRGNITQLEAAFRVKAAGDAWTVLAPVNFDTLEVSLMPVDDGILYEFRLRYVMTDGERGEWTSAQDHTVVGKSAEPDNVTGFVTSQNGAVVAFRWIPVSDLDVKGYKIRRMNTSLPFVWDDAVKVTEITLGSTITTAVVPPGSWKFGIKAIDTSGNESILPGLDDLVVINDFNVISAIEQSPTWPGTRVNLTLTGSLLEVTTPGTLAVYTSDIIDLGKTATVRVWAEVVTQLHDGQSSGEREPELEIRFGNDEAVLMWDAVDTTLMWDAVDTTRMWSDLGPWVPWIVGILNTKFVQQRLTIDTDIGYIDLLTYKPVVDVLPLEEGARDVVISIGSTTITFTKPFLTTPRISVQVKGTVALLAIVDNESDAGFDVQVFNTSGTDVGGTVDWDAITE